MAACEMENSILSHTDLPSADFFLVYNDDFAEQVNEFCRQNNFPAKAISVGSARIENLYEEYLQNEKIIKNVRRRVVYVLGLLYGDANRSNWTDIQIFRLQQKIVKVFVKFGNADYLIKGLAGSDGAYNPLPDFIRGLNLSNFEYLPSGRFTDLLRHGDVFVFDFFSTGLFEALVTSKSVILYEGIFRPPIFDVDLLRRRVQIVSNETDLAAALSLALSGGDSAMNNNREYLNKYIIPRYNDGGVANFAEKFIVDKTTKHA